jgi:hypothetical protein
MKRNKYAVSTGINIIMSLKRDSLSIVYPPNKLFVNVSAMLLLQLNYNLVGDLMRPIWTAQLHLQIPPTYHI